MICNTTVETICQTPAYLDLCFVAGDDFSLTITFPFVITDYSIVARIGSIDFTVNKSTDKILIITLTDTQTAGLSNHAQWSLKLTKNNITRTYISGKYIQS
jgi:hypothetical protein